MKRIRIINGVYCCRISEGVTERKTPDDPAFEVSDEEAVRLVGLKVAEYAEDVQTIDAGSDIPLGTDTEASKRTDTTNNSLRPETDSSYDDSMKFDELKKIAREYGISKARLHKMRSKREVISAIDAAVEKASSKNEEAPKIGAANFV